MAQRPGGWASDAQRYASYQSGDAATGARGGAAQSSADFARLAQAISGSVQRMVHNVSQIESMNGLIGTPVDNPELRDKLHKIQHETNQLAHGITEQLRSLAAVAVSPSIDEQRQRKMQKERLLNDFSTVLKNFQASQRRQKDKEKDAIERTKNKAASPTDLYGEEELVNGQMAPARGSRQQQQQQQMTMFSQDNSEMDLLHDREKNVRQLEADILDVNQIFKDLSVLIHEQGEVIDSIEANVESTSLNIARGTEQLRNARDYRGKIREKKCCLIVVLLAIVAIITIIIAVSVSH